MRFSSIFALAASLATAEGLYFYIEPFTATDVRIPSSSHSISFTVSNPASVFEQGGPDPATCSTSWNTSHPPSCWQTCSGGSGQYYFRVAPGTYSSAAKFDLLVVQSYVYELGNQNNATVHISSKADPAYTCSRGAQTTVCTIEGTSGFNQTLQQYFGGATPVGAPIC